MKRIKLIGYLFSPESNDVMSKVYALAYSNIYLNNLDKMIPSNFYSIYDRLGMIPDSVNHYDRFINKLEQVHNLGCNILEVGGGNLPRIAERIAKRQIDIGCGSITVMDPSLSVKKSKYKNLKLCKEKFTLETDIKDYDLLIGLFPCTVMELMLHKALIENKDLFFRMCDCVHYSDDLSEELYNYYLEHPDYYQKMLIESYVDYSNVFNRNMEVIDDDTPILSIKNKVRSKK